MKNFSKHQEIGKITEEIADTAKFSNVGKVYASPGIIKHIHKHLHQFSKNEKKDIYATMRKICEKPDYIGASPSKIGNSLELIKKFDNNILLAIEIDEDNNYNYVSSMYVVSQGKVNNRLNSLRIVKFGNKNDLQDEVAVEGIKYKDLENIKAIEKTFELNKKKRTK